MNSTFVRKALVALAVLVGLLAAALAYLAATFDANAYKGVAIDWMKSHRNRTLAFDGPITLSVFPRVAIKVSGVRLSEKGRDDQFLRLDEASLSVVLWPLLRTQVVVDRISAKGVHIVYNRSDKGVSNIDDLIASEPAADKPAAKTSEPLRFDVSGIQLDDVRLKLLDGQSKLAGDIALKKFDTGRLADKVEAPVRFYAQVALTQPGVRGDLAGDTQLMLNLAEKSVTLRNMSLQWKGDLPGASAVNATLKGALFVDGAKNTLRADGIELAGGAVFGTVAFKSSSLSVRQFVYEPAGQVLSLKQLAVKLSGTQAGHPLSAGLEWPELSVRGNTLQGSALSGKVEMQGDTAIDASFKTAAPSGNFERIVVPGLDVTLKGRSGPRALSGALRANLTLQPEKGAVFIEGLDAQAQAQEPNLQPLKVSLQGKADASAHISHWALKGQVNANPFTSDGNANLSTTPLTLNASARFDALDLNRLLLPAAAAASSATPETKGPAADAPVDLSPLRSLQGRFDVHVGQFAYRTYRVADFDFKATLDGGMLRVSQLDGRAWGGALNATAFADARASRVAVKANASGVNINALMKDVMAKDVLEGTGQLKLDVDTAGRSVNELKSRLKGTAALQLKDGAVKGINLAKKIREARATLGMKPSDERQKASAQEKTDFSELTASFTIADGIARNSDLDAKSPFLRLGGDGLLDMGLGRIDYTARATVVGTSKGQGGSDLEALKGVTIPVQLTGPFEAMDYRIQWSAIAAQALKSQVGAKLEDKLKDKLGLSSPASAASGASTRDQAKDKLKEKLLKGLLK